MERRFEERKREIEQDAHIDKQALAGYHSEISPADNAFRHNFDSTTIMCER